MTLNPRNAEFASVRLYEAETSVATIAAKHGLDPAAILAPLSGKVNGDAKDLAAWALTARVILNLDETIIRQ